MIKKENKTYTMGICGKCGYTISFYLKTPQEVHNELVRAGWTCKKKLEKETDKHYCPDCKKPK